MNMTFAKVRFVEVRQVLTSEVGFKLIIKYSWELKGPANCVHTEANYT